MGGVRGRPRKYDGDERERRRQAALVSLDRRAERLVVPPSLKQIAEMAEMGLLPVEINDKIDPQALAEALGVNTSPATLQELGRLAERVALAGLIASVLDPNTDEKIKAANLRAMLQGWSKAPTTIANLNVNVDVMPQEELLALGERMFRRPLGDAPRDLPAVSPLVIDADA